MRVHDLRAWTRDRHRTVDDTPYGGGAGMVMRPEPWGDALDALAPPGGQQPRLVVPTPAGVPFSQRRMMGSQAAPPATCRATIRRITAIAIPAMSSGRTKPNGTDP